MGDASDMKLIRNFQNRKSRTQGGAFEPRQQHLAPDTYRCVLVTFRGFDKWSLRPTRSV